jgi:ribosomal protein S18
MTDFSDYDKLTSLKRELAFRERVYPRRIEAGTMTQQQATHELEIMRAIVSDYDERLTKS